MSATPTDSGEREAAWRERRCQHGYPYGGRLCKTCRPPPVFLSRDFAQRILAVLERTMTGDSRDERRALAAELRKVISK